MAWSSAHARYGAHDAEGVSQRLHTLQINAVAAQVQLQASGTAKQALSKEAFSGYVTCSVQGAGFMGSWPGVQRTLLMEPMTRRASANGFASSAPMLFVLKFSCKREAITERCSQQQSCSIMLRRQREGGWVNGFMAWDFSARSLWKRCHGEPWRSPLSRETRPTGGRTNCYSTSQASPNSPMHVHRSEPRTGAQYRRHHRRQWRFAAQARIALVSLPSPVP